jgi:exonuclease III
VNIVSYNLNHRSSAPENNLWQRMIKEISPEIVFAQESFEPSQYFGKEEFFELKGHVVWAPVLGGKWGSAILSPQHALERVDLPGFEGWVSGAWISDFILGGVRCPILVFSVHAPSPGPYERVVGKIFDEIADIWAGEPLIVAGDFNVTTAIRHPSETRKNSGAELKLLERLRREFGLLNTWQILHPNQDLPQTLCWNGNPAEPYHCDAIFASAAFLSCLTGAKVGNSGAWENASDHFPITVSLE